MPETVPPLPERAEAWSAYWASGALHSCATSFSGNYAGALAAFWRTVFDRLPEAARVLDLCCGNAPLSKLLLDAPQHKQVARLDAVDLADIAPPWVAGLNAETASRLHVHARADASALPFSDAQFDLCMSQYGIEYAGAAAFREAARVLRPGGRLAAVLHHVESLPVRMAIVELDHIDWLLGSSDIYLCAGAMIEPMARTSTDAGRAQLKHDATANLARASFNNALQVLNARIQAAPLPDVLIEQRQWLMKLLGDTPRIGAETARAMLGSLLNATRASRLRQQEVIQYACDEAQVRALAACLGDPAPMISTLRFDNGEIAGFGLVAIRAAT